MHTISVGVSKPEDFDIHIEAMEHFDKAAEVAAPIVERLDAAVVEALGKDWAETWHEGLPEWHDVPGEINIPWLIRLYNYVKAYDMVEFGTTRYNLLGSGGHWFPGNKANKLGEHDLTDCLKNSPHAAARPWIA